MKEYGFIEIWAKDKLRCPKHGWTTEWIRNDTDDRHINFWCHVHMTTGRFVCGASVLEVERGS